MVHDRGWVFVRGDVIEAVGAGDPPAGLGHVDVDVDIEPVRQADLVVVDLRGVVVAPVHRVDSSVMLNVTACHMRDVVVDGRVLMAKDGLADVVDPAGLPQAVGPCASLFWCSGFTSAVTR